MSTERTVLFKQFCRAAGIDEGTLTVHYNGGLTIPQFAKIVDLVAHTTGREPDKWTDKYLVVEHVSPDDATHIIAEIRDENSPTERYEKGISIDFEGPGWVDALTLLICRKPVIGEVDV